MHFMVAGEGTDDLELQSATQSLKLYRVQGLAVDGGKNFAP